MRNRDQSGVPETCPWIDEVLTMLDEIRMASAEIEQDDFDRISELLEKVRSANLSLRQWGNENYEMAEERLYDLNKQESAISELKDDVYYLKKELE